VISDLRLSGERVGRLYPILLDRDGKIIDGRHRLAADENWPKRQLEQVETEEKRIIARLISNVCRRPVPAEEKREMLEKLGEIYMKNGVEPGKIARKIGEKTGMSYRWVMKYLPDKYKHSLQSERASAAARRAARGNPKRRVISIDLVEPPEGAVTIKTYRNTNFVNMMLEKRFYKQLEEAAKRLETTADKLIYACARASQ
jgi:DNA-binding transcriptional ArsR family regulator